MMTMSKKRRKAFARHLEWALSADFYCGKDGRYYAMLYLCEVAEAYENYEEGLVNGEG